ncbi:MAG: HypC/HybG/HupF family hydrogenase formation chaperone [Chlamydiae bacterium]|nr:HypC/HybG/HupF family hydrogenase formation chaperone [Chlamydiota bacterium]
MIKTVCIAYTPEAQVHDYVIVHVAFALTILNERHVQETLHLLQNVVL